MGPQPLPQFRRMQVVCIIGAYVPAILASVVVGVSEDWRQALITAGAIALFAIPAIVLNCLFARQPWMLLSFGDRIVVQAGLPAALLTWGLAEGWAPLWTLGWMWTGAALLAALRAELAVRTTAWRRAAREVADVFEFDRRYVSVMRQSAWIMFTAAFAALALAHVGAPWGVCLLLGLVAVVGVPLWRRRAFKRQ